LTLRSETLASRGPPAGRNLPTWRAHDSNSPSDEPSDVDDVDDDDDDDHNGSHFDGSSAVATCGRSWILILSEFSTSFSVTSSGHSLRAPPQ